MPRTYLDHAATTPMTPAARAAMVDGMGRWANPSSPHAEGRAARAALEDARRRIAAAYGWTGDVLLTSGASESLGMVLGRGQAGRRVITAVEHDAVFRAALGAQVLPVGRDGVLGPDSVSTALDTNGAGGTRTAPPFASSEVEKPLVCVQWANSETGVRQPLGAIADAVRKAGGLLLVDAAQMPAGAPLPPADFVAVSGHKRGGPPGIGALLVRDLATLAPTGGQERGYRSGTENLPAALGFAAALEEPEPDHAALRARLDDAIARSGGEIVAAGSPRHAAIGSYRLPGVPATAQLIRLDLGGFAVSAGSACSSGSMKPSHVLAALGWAEAAGREVIRVSFGRTTTADEVEAFITAWRQMARETRRFAA